MHFASFLFTNVHQDEAPTIISQSLKFTFVEFRHKITAANLIASNLFQQCLDKISDENSIETLKENICLSVGLRMKVTYLQSTLGEGINLLWGINFDFSFYLAAPRPTLGHYRGGSLTNRC